MFREHAHSITDLLQSHRKATYLPGSGGLLQQGTENMVQKLLFCL